MILVHVLYDAEFSRNSEAFLFPLIVYRRQLKREHNVRISFFSCISPELLSCDVLCVSSKFFSAWWSRQEGMQVKDFLQKARTRVNRLEWFDHADSTGATQFRVLPYVDRYYKNQILRDRQQYQRVMYGTRVTTDFYHNFFGVSDTVVDEPHLNHIPSVPDLLKIQVGWNYGLAHYGLYGEMLGKLLYPWPLLPRVRPRHWYAPSTKRALPVSCRMGMSYARETVARSRQEVKKRLHGRIPTDRLPRRKYFAEMTQSVSGVSPFGWGEVCYRDFELTLSGAAMIKQDMNHLETWPDLYVREKTYLPFQWNLSDFEEKIEYAITHPAEMVERAFAAQAIYKRVMMTEEGGNEFCARFVRMISA